MENPNIPFSAFKSIKDYRMTAYPVYASHTYTYVSGSTSNSEDVLVLNGIHYTGSSIDRILPNAEYELFDSVKQTFYSDLAYTLNGITSESYSPTNSSSLWVISITQDVYGETIVPNTTRLILGGTSSYDDGVGNLYVSQSGVAYYVGNVFYDQGIIVVKGTKAGTTYIGSNGMSIVSGSNLQVDFTSSVSLIEHLINVTVEPNEFTLSAYNPQSLKAPYTGSTVPVIESMISGNIKPYVVSIGLYNDDNDLVAVAKLSNPIKRTFDTTQTFVVKFDT